MDVRQLNYFLSIVDHGGFGRAAAVLSTTDIRTDLGGSATTTQFSDAVIHSLERVPN